MENKGVNLKNESKTFKGTSLIGQAGGPISVVDSSEGKITRIRPYHFEDWPGFKDIEP